MENIFNVSNNIVRTANSAYDRLNKIAFRLSSGLRINSASDDPAGLVISEQMRARIASLNREIENVAGQINKYETASSTMLQMRSMLTEIRSLAVAAANEGYNDETMLGVYQDEANRLVNAYNGIVRTAQFGSQYLLNGSDGALVNAAELAQVNLSDSTNASEAITYIDEAANRLDRDIGQLGATQKNELESRLRNLRIESENLQAAESQIRDADMAKEYTNFLKEKLILQSSISLLAHSYLLPHVTLSLLLSTDK